jgi:hypothetical protein
MVGEGQKTKDEGNDSQGCSLSFGLSSLQLMAHVQNGCRQRPRLRFMKIENLIG